MSDITKFWIGAAGGPLLLVALMLCMLSPEYIPDVKLANAARAGPTESDAKVAMFNTLERCFRTGDLSPEDVGQRLSVLYSFENDVGFLARTTLTCDGHSCKVQAEALIAHAARPDTCRGPYRRGQGRTNGWSDYFPLAGSR